jgi:hypothetical protein
MEVRVSFTPRGLYPQGKTPWYPLYRRLGGPQSRSGRGGKEENCQFLWGLEPLIIQLVAQRYTTELSQRLYIGFIYCVLCIQFEQKLSVNEIVNVNLEMVQIALLEGSNWRT